MLRRRTIRLVLSRRQNLMPDITTLRRLPASSTFPVQRNGIDPVPQLCETRDRGPVTKLTSLMGVDIWLVTGFEEAREVLADLHRYSNDMRHVLGNRPRTAAESIGGLGMTDPPDHTRLRGLLTPEFTKHRLGRLQGSIDEIVAETLDDVAARGPDVDLVPHFGFAIPFRVICELLGLSVEDRAPFHELGIARFDLSNGGAGVFGAATESRSLLIEAVRRQRRDPRGGLIGALIRDHGDDFDDVELGGLVDGLFLGGYETSASMLSMGAYVLLQQPDAWETMRTGTAAEVDGVVEELLRLLCPVQLAFPRFAREDIELGGQHVDKGDVVLVSLSAANRDPRTIHDPEQFTLHSDRTAHLAFGHGLHRCVGAELARMEIRTALTGLAQRFPDLALAPGSEPSFRELSIVHSIDSLPTRLAIAKPAQSA
ncbi:cytochrome P450 [Nocardioides endophyticus]|uniref:Cytochrome P450 n=1 Tax=Nocardioides endophyticus TaxID=1353775 RepID=A0ABP8YZA6_9ACTN